MVAAAWRIFTLAAVVAAWIPFRAASLSQATTMLGSMFVRFSGGYSYSVNFYLMVAVWCVWIAIEPAAGRLIARLGTPEAPGVMSAFNRGLLRPASYACLLLLFFMFDDRDTQFIYFQF